MEKRSCVGQRANLSSLQIHLGSRKGTVSISLNIPSLFFKLLLLLSIVEKTSVCSWPFSADAGFCRYELSNARGLHLHIQNYYRAPSDASSSYASKLQGV